MKEWFQGMEYVYEVYKEKSFSKAAKNLFISQPSLSANVKRIEDKIGSPLFDRSVSPVRPTECGLNYIRAAEKIRDIERNFYTYVTDLEGLKSGSLKLGGSSFCSSYVFPDIVRPYYNKYPHVKISLTEGGTPELLELLKHGALDIVMDNSAPDEKSFEGMRIGKERLLLAVPRRFEKTRSLQAFEMTDTFQGKPVDLAEFQDFPFIMLKHENDTRVRGERLCREAGFKPEIYLELDQQATAFNLAACGMGLTFVSDTLINSTGHPDDLALYPLEGEGASRSLYLFWKKGRYLSRAMEEFLRMAPDFVKSDCISREPVIN